ncbi:MAG: alpha/beta hydrolase [Acinetobacter sp.]|nr:alpha/beta hydrolase [Acinetobacter sp.]MBP7218762.1 alpha/beta hydrolase [Acinetobacter sp.]
MTALPQKLQQLLDKGQGPAARILDKMPKIVQESISKALAYPYQYPELDAFTKCIMAVQMKQGRSGLIGADLVQSRREFDAQMLSIVSKATFVAEVEDIRLPLQSGTLFARHYHPAPNKKLPMLVFYHGGGFVIGGLDTHDEACRIIAKYAKVQVLSIDYPLAPETSPQLLIQSCEDALAWVYQNRRQLKIHKNYIAVAGDSAGANIATVVSQHSIGKPYAPQAQLLIYPTVDFKSKHPSYYAYGQGLVLTAEDIAHVTGFYAEQHDVALDDPLISPTYGNLKKLAAAYVVTAGHDILHDEGEIYSHKLRQNGVKVQYVNYVDQTHGFINITPISSKAKRHTIEMAKNFKKFWDQHH